MHFIISLSQKKVGKWLKKLKLEIYTRLFEVKGYSEAVDMENLIGLNKEYLQHMGITRRG